MTTDHTSPQPPYPIKLPVTWPEDTPFEELPLHVQRRILKVLGIEADDG